MGRETSGPIEFIAGHELQAICAASVFSELSKTHDCRWRIGRRLSYEGGFAAVLLDHTQNHPAVTTSWRGYQHAFYMMHDLGDAGSYMRSRKQLRRFTAVFVPDGVHRQWAEKALGRSVPIAEVGWPKFDPIPLSERESECLARVRNLPRDVPTILYAPNCPTDQSWDELWAHLKEGPYNLIIKNATYGVAPGEQVPDYYQRIIRTIDRMEAEAAAAGRAAVVIAPREMNVCALFPYAQLMISSKSSVLPEFLPYGVSVETDIPFPPQCDSPLISRTYPDVVLLENEELRALVSVEGRLQDFIRQHPPKPAGTYFPYPNGTVTSGQRTAELIRHYLSKPRWRQAWRRTYAAARL